MGVEGLGRRALAGEPSPGARDLAADLDQLGMQVTPENVLGVRNALKGEAVRLFQILERHATDLRVYPPGKDPVSLHATPEFNRKIDSLVADCRAYVEALDRAGDLLSGVARAYGCTEAEITASFQSYRESRQAEWRTQLDDHEAAARLHPLIRSLTEIPSPSPSTPGQPGMFGAQA